MLFVIVYLSLMSPEVAQSAPPAPLSAPAPQAQVAAPAPTVAEAPVVEEPKIKKVCHLEDVAGSAFPRTVCKMKPIKPTGAM